MNQCCCVHDPNGPFCDPCLNANHDYCENKKEIGR